MKIRHHSLSQAGRGRRSNQDRLLIDDECLAFAVADGLGGMVAGDLASTAAVAAIAADAKDDGCVVFEDLPHVVEDANTAVRSAGSRYARGIATTLTLAHLTDNRVEVAHIGDSAAILIRDGRSRLLTRPHRTGTSRRNLFDIVPGRPEYNAALEKALGPCGAHEADYLEVTIRRGDILVLATDGLTADVGINEIGNICTLHDSPEASVTNLFELACERGGYDDITIVVVAVDEL